MTRPPFYSSPHMKHVIKIGGSNLKSAEDLEHLRTVVGLYAEPPVIVLSAVYGVTDRLIALIETVVEPSANIDALLTPILKSYTDMLEPYVTEELRSGMHEAFTENSASLKRYLVGIQSFAVAPDFAYHFVVSFGERLSALMVRLFFGYKGIRCLELLPENCSMVTAGAFPHKELNFAACSAGLQNAVTENCLYAVPGFYAMSTDGKVTLLGRGGTDYSAAAIAYCLKAESLDFWKDVDGFLSADPKLVPSAHLISRLSYGEAAELSYFGAKILHPRTMHPVKLGGIPARILNIRDAVNKPGTVISSEGERSDHGIRSVSHSLDFGILRLAGPDVGMEAGIISTVSALFNTHELNIKSIITSQTTINFLFEKDNLARARQLVDNLKLEAIEELECVDDIAVLALVGEGFREHPDVLARALSALSRERIAVLLMVAGASSVSAYIVVSRNSLSTALTAVHCEFFGQ